MPVTEGQTSQSGIVTDANGQRHIPSSQRADGTTRREIKIRPGYKPPEDVEVYRNRTAQSSRSRGKGAVPGAEAVDDSSTSKPSTTASNKNAKRREARRKTKALDDAEAAEDTVKTDERSKITPELSSQAGSLGELKQSVADVTVNPEAEKERKAKRLRKKLREARELQEKKERGEGLLPSSCRKLSR